jgi:hypothetical protein
VDDGFAAQATTAQVSRQRLMEGQGATRTAVTVMSDVPLAGQAQAQRPVAGETAELAPVRRQPVEQFPDGYLHGRASLFNLAPLNVRRLEVLAVL